MFSALPPSLSSSICLCFFVPLSELSRFLPLTLTLPLCIIRATIFLCWIFLCKLSLSVLSIFICNAMPNEMYIVHTVCSHHSIFFGSSVIHIWLYRECKRNVQIHVQVKNTRTFFFFHTDAHAHTLFPPSVSYSLVFPFLGSCTIWKWFRNEKYSRVTECMFQAPRREHNFIIGVGCCTISRSIVL